MKPYAHLAAPAALAALALAACAPAAPTPLPGQAVVEAHVAGFNARDIDAMRAVQHPDAAWFAVAGDTLSLITDDRDAWNAIMRDTFAQEPDLRGELRDWTVAGERIAVTEVAVRVRPDGTEQRRDTLTAYQIEDGLIRRVWYFMDE